jgi:thiosulfate reductase cytochrome b subunit
MSVKPSATVEPFVPVRILRWRQEKTGRTRATAYEHPLLVRYCHWLNTISLIIMAASGLQIFMAFPSFGPKIPQRDFLHVPGFLALGGWLGGALQWHLTFAWLYIVTGIVYVGYEFAGGNYRQVLITGRDLRGLWPMTKYYFFRGKKPNALEPYNPLQKLAYTSAILIGVLSVWTGLAIYKPVQFSALAWPLGGFRLARVWHFAALCLFAAFVIGHLTMVALHGWQNFISMFTGWKRDPEYLPEESARTVPDEGATQSPAENPAPRSDEKPARDIAQNPKERTNENPDPSATSNPAQRLQEGPKQTH